MACSGQLTANARWVVQTLSSIFSSAIVPVPLCGEYRAPGRDTRPCRSWSGSTPRRRSASLTLSEDADPSVRRALERFFARLVPDGDAIFGHTAEGPDDVPAHVRTILTQNSLTIP